MFDFQDLFQWDRFITPTIIKTFYWLIIALICLMGISGVFSGLAAGTYAIGLVPQGLAGTVAVIALTIMLSMKLIGFLMLAMRYEALSHILGLLVLENGIFLGAQILVPGMPVPG